jgi:hypothetical protein
VDCLWRTRETFATASARRPRAGHPCRWLRDREAASRQLRDYVEHVPPLTLVAQEKNRVLYLANQ